MLTRSLFWESLIWRRSASDQLFCSNFFFFFLFLSFSSLGWFILSPLSLSSFRSISFSLTANSSLWSLFFRPSFTLILFSTYSRRLRLDCSYLDSYFFRTSDSAKVCFAFSRIFWRPYSRHLSKGKWPRASTYLYSPRVSFCGRFPFRVDLSLTSKILYRLEGSWFWRAGRFTEEWSSLVTGAFHFGGFKERLPDWGGGDGSKEDHYGEILIFELRGLSFSMEEDGFRVNKLACLLVALVFSLSLLIIDYLLYLSSMHRISSPTCSIAKELLLNGSSSRSESFRFRRVGRSSA